MYPVKAARAAMRVIPVADERPVLLFHLKGDFVGSALYRIFAQMGEEGQLDGILARCSEEPATGVALAVAKTGEDEIG